MWKAWHGVALAIAGVVLLSVLTSSSGTAQDEPRETPAEPLFIDDIQLTKDFVISVPAPPGAVIQLTALDTKTKQELPEGRKTFDPLAELLAFDRPLKWSAPANLLKGEAVDLRIDASAGGRRIGVTRTTTILAQASPQQVAALSKSGSKDLGIYPEKFWPASDKLVLFAYYVKQKCWVWLQVRETKTTARQVVWESDEGARERGASAVNWDGNSPQGMAPTGKYQLIMKVWWNVPNPPWKPNPRTPSYQIDETFELLR